MQLAYADAKIHNSTPVCHQNKNKLKAPSHQNLQVDETQHSGFMKFQSTIKEYTLATLWRSK
jgi:hypothetical protein